MPIKIILETEDEPETATENIKPPKVKNGKMKKKKSLPMDEAAEQDPLVPKKKRKKEGAEPAVVAGMNGTANGKLPVETTVTPKKQRDALTNGAVPVSSQEAGGSPTDSSPIHVSEQSTSDTEKEESPEQSEGAFSNFRISKDTIRLLQARGVTYLFDIQVKTFDSVYDGKDVVAQARTGTGKTFSFAIPLIERLTSAAEERKRGRAPKVLVLTPTRELAIQVAKDFRDVTKKLVVSCFYGGSSYNPQMESIRNGIDILVGTPGRIKDLYQNSKLDLTQLKHVVLDEVDQMLDMGFAEQVEEILAASYKKGSQANPQTLLFSATCPHWVYDVAKKYMRLEYEHVDLIGKRTAKTATTVEHLAIACHWSQRAAVIGDVIQVYSGSHGRTIIFCETKKEATELSLNTSMKQSAQSLHGDIPQKQREITLKGFRNGSFEVLVATNVAARGLDIPEVDLVIQCSPPKDVESYIHRSGRTGRAGRTGVCICLYQRKEEEQLHFVEHKAGITFKRVGVPTANDIIKSSSKDAVRYLDAVPSMAIEYFRSAAEQLIAERGAVPALAAALAHISGATALEQRSLLNSDAGYTTILLKCSQEMHSISYAWKTLKEQLGEEIDSHIQRMTFLKGKMGVCFDVVVDRVKSIEEVWQNSRRWELSVATELPELEESRRISGGDRNSAGGGRHFSRGGSGRGGGGRSGRGGGGRGGGGRRGRGGYGDRSRGNNDSGRGRGQKRSFNRAFDY